MAWGEFLRDYRRAKELTPQYPASRLTGSASLQVELANR